jgi:hypothetical protein
MKEKLKENNKLHIDWILFWNKKILKKIFLCSFYVEIIKIYSKNILEIH